MNLTTSSGGGVVRQALACLRQWLVWLGLALALKAAVPLPAAPLTSVMASPGQFASLVSLGEFTRAPARAAAATDCPGQPPTRTVVLTNVVTVPSTVTNITSTNRPVIAILCTNQFTTNITTVPELATSFILTNVTTFETVFVDTLITNISIQTVAYTNVTTAPQQTSIIVDQLRCTDQVTHQTDPEGNLVTCGSYLVTNQVRAAASPVPGRHSFPSAVPIDAHEVLDVVAFTNVCSTNPPGSKFAIPSILCINVPVTVVITTNLTVTDVVFTNITVTNLTIEPRLTTVAVVTPTTVPYTYLTNRAVITVVTTNVCVTNVTFAPGFITNVIVTNGFLTNLITTNVLTAGVRFRTNRIAHAENGGPILVFLERIGDPAPAVSVRVRSADGTAMAGPDFTAVDRVVAFGAGVTVQSFTVTPTDDQVPEPDETFNLGLSEPVDCVTLDPCAAIFTIRDDDVAADLVLTKTNRFVALPVGHTNEWILKLRNLGPSAATNIVVSDDLPGGFPALYSRTGVGQNWSDDRGTWTVPSLAVGAEATLTLGFRWLAPEWVTNCAAITGATPADPVRSNNAACTAARWYRLTNDLAITKIALSTQANVGALVAFRLTVSNLGPDRADVVYVNDLLPPEVTLVSADLPPGTISSPGTPGSYTLPALAAGASASLTLNLRSLTPGWRTNCATVSDGSGAIDPVAANNTACARAVWGPLADLEVYAAPGRPFPEVIAERTEFALAFLVTNRGPDSTTNVSTKITLPGQLLRRGQTFTGRPSVWEPLTGTWRVTGPLRSNEFARLELLLAATVPGRVDATADLATSETADPDSTPGNNDPAEDDYSKYSFTVVSNYAVHGTVFFCDGLPTNAFRPSLEFTVKRGTNVVTTARAVSGNGDTRAYSIPDLAAGTYQLEARAPGYQVLPRTPVFTVGPANLNPVIDVDAVIPYLTVAITPCGTGPLPTNISVALAGGGTLQLLALGPDGTVNFTNLTAGTAYTAVPLHPWLTFSGPTNRLVIRSNAPCANPLTFVACPTLSVSGRLLTCNTNGPGLPLVPLTLSRGPTIAGTTVTGTNGFYQFTNLWPGDYTITAPTNLVRLTPATTRVTVTATPVVTNLLVETALFIGGRVTENSNTGPALPNLAIILKGPGGLLRTNLTDTNGYFAFTNLAAGTYTVRPYTNQPAFRFSPTNATLSSGAGPGCTNFANFIAGISRAELVSLEVMQAVQDWTNGVRLVRDKPTFVRAHLQPWGTNPAPVKIAGAKLLVRAGGALLETVNAENGMILALTNAAGRRTNLLSSLNFPIRASSTRRGPVTFEFKWTNGIVFPREPAAHGDPASNAIVTAEFITVPPMKVKWVDVQWTNHFLVTNRLLGFQVVVTNVFTNRPSQALFDTFQREVVSLFPIATVDATVRPLFWSPAQGAPLRPGVSVHDTNGVKLWHLIHAVRAADADLKSLYSGVVTNGPGGVADAGFIRNWGGDGIAFVQYVGPDDERRHETGHEMGHALGRPHPLSALIGSLPGGRILGACGESTEVLAEEFPVHRLPGSLVFKPTLGPVVSNAPTDWVLGWYQDRKLLINPFKSFEVMSYCNGDPKWKWTSRYTYEKLFDAIVARFAPPPVPFGFAAVSPGPTILIRGGIDPRTDATTLAPLYTLPPGGPAQLPEPGPYRIRQVDGAGVVLLEVPFAVSQPTGESGELPAGDADGAFAFRLPLDPATQRVQVWREATLLAERRASAAFPELTLAAPVTGAAYGPDSLPVAWSGTDADGDALHALVQLSLDGGASWETIALDVTGNRLAYPHDTLRGGTTARLRLLLTDGFHTTMAGVGPFTIANHPPRGDLLHPANGEQFAHGQQIIFETTAHDSEDGDLADDLVRWFSDRDGEFGSGARFSLPADDLSVGRHDIQVVLRDVDGGSKTNRISLEITAAMAPTLRVVATATGVVLSWSRLFEDYQLERLDTLGLGAWTPVAGVPIAGEDEWTWEIPSDADTQFFRLNQPAE